MPAHPTSCRGCLKPCGSSSAISRRNLLAGLAAAPAVSAAAPPKDPARQQPIESKLTVQPLLLYQIPQRREARSWRQWGGLMTQADVDREKQRIETELRQASVGAGFPLETLPLRTAATIDEASKAAEGSHDVILLYAAGGNTQLLEQASAGKAHKLMFVRHRSGPVYLWYEIAHPRYLRKMVDEYGQPGVGVDDVIVDEYKDVVSRWRGLFGLKNTMGKKVVAVGGPSGWGTGGKQAPRRASETFGLDLVTVSYEDLGARIAKSRDNAARVKQARAAADAYLKDRTVSLETRREFVERAFLLTEVFRDLLDEHRTDAITINQCMSTIMPVGETTACLPLSLLNDEGYMAFCESDFVVIPSGILLRYVSRKPVFLNDPTYPHHGVVTLAHCTAPRKMDAEHAEPARVLTHFESDYGAAPKVEMKIGQKVTNIVPDFNFKEWVGFAGDIVANPFLPICRSQIDVTIEGDQQKLLREMKGFHWMTGYGDYRREFGYALEKAGVKWIDVGKA